MKYLMSYILCTLSVYFPSNILISTFQIDHNPNIDDLIDKLLKSDKFDELANKIAEKAVEKIKDMQDRNYSTNVKEKNEIIYRNSAEKRVSTNDLFPKSMFDDDFVKSIINRDSFDNLSLKYVKFVKNKSKNASGEKDSLSIENSIANISTEINSNTKKNKGDLDQKLQEDIKLSKEKSISDSISYEDKEKTNKKTIKKIGKNIESDKENDPMLESEQIVNNESGEINGNSTTIIMDSKENEHLKLSEEVKYKDHSADLTTPRNKDKKKNKKPLRKENDRVYFLESSSEYDGYKDKIYDALED